MRIVIVDDNRDDRALAVRAVRQAMQQADIVEAWDSGTFDAAIATRPDLVITDYALRDTNGLELLQRVERRYPGLPVIMFTNTGSEEVAAQALRLGAADYVIKRSSEFPRLAVAAKNAVARAELHARVEVLLEKEREARLEAERASRMREEFLAVVSHELRTPLNAIVGWANLLQLEAFNTDAERKNAYAVIMRNAKLQASLIDDLLDLSRIVAGRLSLRRESVSLANIVRESINAMLPTAEAHRVSIVERLDYDGPLYADAGRVTQVLRNLIENAINFSKADSVVEVTTREIKGAVEISVRDYGAGIAAEFLPYIFERFRQADSSSTRKVGGMGIGLSIARHIVEAHEGKIQVLSDGPGKGSNFVVRLPMAAGAAPVKRANHAEPLPRLQGIRVLVIEDDADSLGMMQRALTLVGASVSAAASAKDGLALFEAERPAVIICDIGMPGEDGYSFLQRLRRREAGKNILAIALTAFTSAADRDKALQAGFAMHVGKPVDAEELIRTVATALTASDTTSGDQSISGAAR